MEISIAAVPTQWVAYRSATSTLQCLGNNIQSTLGPIYGMSGVSGTPYARYLEWRDVDCDFQAGVLLRARVHPQGDISVDLYNACKAVRVAFRGTYEDRYQAHEAARAHALENGMEVGGPLWEVFDGPPDAEGVAKVVIYLPLVT